MRFYKIAVVFFLVLTCSKPASADLKLNSKKEKQRKQAKLEVRIDAMVKDADHKFQFDDSIENAIEILKEAYFLSDKSNYTVGIISSANLLEMVTSITQTFPTQPRSLHISPTC